MTSKQALGLTMNELAEVNAEHVTTISKLEQKLTDMAVQLANAESKCRELAAENAALKEVVSGVNSELYGQGFEVSGWHLNGALEPLDNWFTDNGWGMPETPATDAFLSEVRAQGVEMAACALDDVNQFNYANMLDDLAQKLRKDSNTADPLAAGIITEVGE